MSESKKYSFSYLEGGYSEVWAENLNHAQCEAEKLVKEKNINKTINWGSFQLGSFI